MHEIITLQLGQRSNYVATHFWNIQESYFTYSTTEVSLLNHDVHFRAGVGADGSETFTPRTLIYDLKGGFGSLRKFNALYETREEGIPTGIWDGKTVLQKAEPMEQSEYQKALELGTQAPLSTPFVRFWSDFNRVYYHPRSCVQLSEYELGSSLMPFETWIAGEELYAELDREHDLFDRDFRPWAEECDQLQGIQMFTGVDDAWGGFAARYVDRLRDEFGKTSLWVWGMEDGSVVQRSKQQLRTANLAHSLCEVSIQASLFVSLQEPRALPPYVAMERGSLWHSSALLATAIESIGLPSRLRHAGSILSSLGTMEQTVNVNGNQNIAKLQLSVSEPSTARDNMANSPEKEADSRIPGMRSNALFDDSPAGLKNFDMDFLPPRLPGCRKQRREEKVFARVECYRGDIQRGIIDILDGTSTREFQSRRLNRRAGLPPVQRFQTALCYPQLDSSPPLYQWPGAPTALAPAAVAVAAAGFGLSAQTALSSSSMVACWINSVREMATKTVFADEREQLGNALGEMAEAYEEGWASSSDVDADD
ncbi:MAG: mtDNA inheritance, partitioning of the mitochondrial organelle [Trizodia sp. TS-e1964]|nr:MAG: mtDNA inheritance, partitioning of the mitochondrial organelle [Trizodia sp. TS-e1964]